ncbi:hypothetical protein P2318_20765 [Myxococcaceae bacterium GXIMD 01537]
METTKTGGTRNLERLLKGSLEEAQKRFQGLELEAEKLVQDLKSRGEESRKELNQLLEHPRLKELGRRVDVAGGELKRRIGGIQSRVVESVGVASQSQVKEIRSELSKLSKKLDGLVGTATAAVSNRAAHLTGKRSADKTNAPQV